MRMSPTPFKEATEKGAFMSLMNTFYPIIMLRKLTVLFILGILSNISFGQCSDAGVCSIASHPSEYSLPGYSLGLGYSIGSSGKEDKITYHSLSVKGSYDILTNVSLSLAVPFNIQTSDYSTISGIGDISFVSNFFLWREEMFPLTSDTVFAHEPPIFGGLQFQLGGKFATGRVNEKNLPLKYQSGLGTSDLLLGMTYTHQGFLLGVGYQHPFGITKNSFDSIGRGPDFLWRISYSTRVGDFNFSGDILAIKRLAETKQYVDSNFVFTTEFSPDPIDVSKGYYKILGSNQFQINFSARAQYILSIHTTTEIGVAFPLLKRKENSDGLKRAFTISVGITTQFW